MEIVNKMQYHTIRTNSERIYEHDEDGSILQTLIFIKSIGSDTL